MTAHLLVLRSGQGTPGAERAVDFARVWLAQNRTVAVVLIQEGVLAALDNGDQLAQQRLRAAISEGARCVYQAEDLARRGFGPDDTLVGCESTGYDGLADLLVAGGTLVTGAF